MNTPNLRRKISLALFVVLVMPLVGFFGYQFGYEPLKFRYLIWRVESAKTVAEEREAFALAARRGRVWEVDRLRPGELPEGARHLTGNWIIKLEWLESSAWTGKPYRAYRSVLETNNIAVLRRKEK